MRTVVVDTNAFISYVTDRNLDQQEKIAGIFEATAQLKLRIFCPQNVLTEFVYVHVYVSEKQSFRKIA